MDLNSAGDIQFCQKPGLYPKLQKIHFQRTHELHIHMLVTALYLGNSRIQIRCSLYFTCTVPKPQCSFLLPGDQHMLHINISKCAECVQNLCWRSFSMALLSQRPLWVMLNQYINAHHRFSLQFGKQSPPSLH